jgi:hypothetical protein
MTAFTGRRYLACTMHEAMDFVDHQSEYRDVEA